MKKSLLTVVLTLCVSSAFAFSWNGVLDENFKITTSDFENVVVDQSNGVYLSFKTPLSDSFRLAGEGLYRYNLHVTDEKTSLSHIADVDLFKLSGIWKNGTSNIALDAGRFIVSDASGAVFSQCSDGLNLKYETAKWKTGFYAGYTGLLNSLNVSMTDGAVSDSEVYRLSAAYVPVSVNYAYTSFLGTNVIGVQGSFYKGISDGLTDKLYGTVTLNGNVGKNGTYSTAVVVGLNDYSDLMLYAKFDYSAYIKNNAVITAGMEYASGNQGPFKSFKSITAKYASGTGIVNSGVIVPKFSGIFVADKMLASINEKVILLMPETSADFAGVDSTLSILYNVLSDVQIGCDVMAFTGKDSDNNKFSITAKASLAF